MSSVSPVTELPEYTRVCINACVWIVVGLGGSARMRRTTQGAVAKGVRASQQLLQQVVCC